MVISGRERLLNDWAQAWSSSDKEEQLISLFTDDCLYEDVAMGVVNHGKEELRNFYKLIFRTFPDLRVELKLHFVTDRYAAAEWLFTGTHKGDLPELPATNKPCSIRGSTIIELRGEKIKRISDYWDMVAFLKQVGAMPSS